MFYYTYVLKDATGDLYIGWTADLKTRLEHHQKGLVATTAKSLPVELVYYEACRSESAAIQREKALKTGYGRSYLHRRLNTPEHGNPTIA